ncbi:hypothetical protein GCM10027051_17940 [Niabella terrae]
MSYYSIKEKALIARLAAFKLKSEQVAIVIGHSIYLHGVTRQQFLQNQRWLRHELKHVEQYERLGLIRFIVTYLWQTLKVGYYRCGLECEARAAETDASLPEKFQLRPD